MSDCVVSVGHGIVSSPENIYNAHYKNSVVVYCLGIDSARKRKLYAGGIEIDTQISVTCILITAG